MSIVARPLTHRLPTKWWRKLLPVGFLNLSLIYNYTFYYHLLSAPLGVHFARIMHGKDEGPYIAVITIVFIVSTILLPAMNSVFESNHSERERVRLFGLNASVSTLVILAASFAVSSFFFLLSSLLVLAMHVRQKAGGEVEPEAV